MNIKELAEQAGFVFGDTYWTERDLTPLLERLVELVAAHEREECAQVCEDAKQEYDCIGHERELKYTCADAIRARSKA